MTTLKLVLAAAFCSLMVLGAHPAAARPNCSEFHCALNCSENNCAHFGSGWQQSSCNNYCNNSGSACGTTCIKPGGYAASNVGRTTATLGVSPVVSCPNGGVPSMVGGQMACSYDNTPNIVKVAPIVIEAPAIK